MYAQQRSHRIRMCAFMYPVKATRPRTTSMYSPVRSFVLQLLVGLVTFSVMHLVSVHSIQQSPHSTHGILHGSSDKSGDMWRCAFVRRHKVPYVGPASLLAPNLVGGWLPDLRHRSAPACRSCFLLRSFSASMSGWSTVCNRPAGSLPQGWFYLDHEFLGTAFVA